MNLAKDHPRALSALSTASKAAPALDIGETVAMLAIAAQLDKRVIEPDHMLPAITGVNKYWVMINGPIEHYVWQREQSKLRSPIDEETHFVPVR